jgi:SAM-dependent methyltransferase
VGVTNYGIEGSRSDVGPDRFLTKNQQAHTFFVRTAAHDLLKWPRLTRISCNMTAGKTLLNTVHDRLAFRRRVRVLSDIVARTLPANAQVLDVGTGDGSIAALIMERRDDVTIQGVDVLLRSETRIPVKLLEGYHLPFDDDTFDCVMFVDVLHHTLDPSIHISEAARVSKRYLVIKDHLLEGVFAGPVLRFMDWFGNRGHEVVLPYNYLSRTRWEEIFSHAGLEVDLWIDRLGLYSAPAAWLFERRLHFVARLAKHQSIT